MTDAKPRKLSRYFTASRRKGRADLPLMSVTMHNGLVRRDEMDRKMDSALAPEEHLLVEPNDIAYNTMRMWQGCFGLAEKAANVSPAYVVMRPKDTVDPRFAAHWFKSDRGLYMLWAYSYGLTEDRLRLYGDEFLQIPVTWPSQRTQTLIANVLDQWDDAIASIARLASAKAAMLRALSHQFYKLEGATIPLAKLVKINLNSLGNRTPDNFKFEYFPIGDEEDAGGWMNFGESPSRARRLAQPGDVVYSTVRPLLRRTLIAQEHESAVYSTGYAILNPKIGDDSEYIYHLMASEVVERQVYSMLTGSGYPAVSASDLRTIQVPNLDAGERRRIGHILGSFAEEKQALDAACSALRRQKRGLMQKLLTGELQVPESIDRLMPGGDAAATLASEASAI